MNKGSVQEPLSDGLVNPDQNRPKITVPHDQEVIGNFDDGSTNMNPQLYKAPNGTWSAYSYAGNTVNYPFVVAGGANGTKMAAHVSGTLANKGDATYPAFLLSGKFTPAGYYDAGAFSGIRFYYKCPNDQASNRRFNIATAPTTPPSAGGTCASNCYDHFGQDLSQANDWTLVTVSFKDAKRIGWGSPVAPPDFTDHLNQIIDIEWTHNTQNTPGKVTIDYWVDEVEFY